MGVGTYLGIPKVRRQVITPLTKLEREDLVHSQARKIRRRSAPVTTDFRNLRCDV